MQTISEHVSVVFDESPKIVVWKNRQYEIKKVGLHHKYTKGKILYHVFSVVTDTSFLRLVLNTNNLLWKLEEISDGF